MASIRAIIEAEEITQVQAAERFGVSQPRISDLVRGKIDLLRAAPSEIGRRGHVAVRDYLLRQLAEALELELRVERIVRPVLDLDLAAAGCGSSGRRRP